MKLTTLMAGIASAMIIAAPALAQQTDKAGLRSGQWICLQRYMRVSRADRFTESRPQSLLLHGCRGRT